MSNTKQLPELPTPKYSETIRGVPCITLIEHEHLMRTYALQAIAKATQTADVTDEQINAAYLAWCKTNGTPESFALRPERVPMTDEQWLEYLLRNANNSVLHVAAFVGESSQTRGRWALLEPANNLRKLVEQAYGITAQSKKEGA